MQTPKDRILVADGEPLVVRLLVSELPNLGFDVDAAVDGPGALASGRSGSYVAILLSSSLPGMDALEVAHVLRNAGVRTPIIFASGSFHDFPAGAPADVFLLSKPFTLTDLRACLSRALGRKV